MGTCWALSSSSTKTENISPFYLLRYNENLGEKYPSTEKSREKGKERKPLGVRLGSEELEELTGFKHMEYFVLRVVLFTQVWEGTESNGRVDWLMEKEE